MATEKQAVQLGEKLLEQKANLADTEILAEGLENSNRKVQLIKVTEAYHLFKDLIVYYAGSQLISFIEKEKAGSFEELIKKIGKPVRAEWANLGGQLVPKSSLHTLIRNIHQDKVSEWHQVHEFYKNCSNQYPQQKLEHSLGSLFEILNITPEKFTARIFKQVLERSVATKEWIVKGIYESRAKDYESEFRKMVYDSAKEMDKVIGKLKDNSFILHQQEELKQFKKQAAGILKRFKL
jgi:hypothetical protein